MYNKLLVLLRASLTDIAINLSVFEGMNPKEWICLLDYATQQGVIAVACEGLVNISNNKTSFKEKPKEPCTLDKLGIDIDTLMEWVGQGHYVKSRNETHQNGVNALSGIYKEAGIDMLLLKGLSLANYYPMPETREFGDLDVFSLPHSVSNISYVDEFKEVHDKLNKAVESKGVDIEYWGKHDVFNFGGVHVEHHSYFVNKNSYAAKRVNEKLLEIIARDKSVRISDNVYYPSPDFNAIFIMNHTIGHMSYEGAILKNVIDWALFLKADGDKVNWKDITPFLTEIKWNVGFDTLTRVAEFVIDLDFSRFYIDKPNEALSKKVLDTILDTTLHQDANYPLPKRVIKKTERLFSHRWMYTSGLIPANFWTDCVWGSIKEHLERPEQF